MYRDRFVNIDGLWVHYLEWGRADRPTVVLLHGFRETCRSWDDVAAYLARWYRVLAVDARNHGESDSTPDEHDSSMRVADLAGFLDTLKLGSTALLGHSMGGRQAMTFATMSPERVRWLAIEDVGPVYEAMTGPRPAGVGFKPVEPRPTLDDFMRTTYNRRRDHAFNRRKALLMRRPLAGGGFAPKFTATLGGGKPEDRPELWNVLDRITCPTLVVRGGESHVLSGDVHERMVARLPDGHGVTIDGARHRVHEDDPMAFLTALSEFLDCAVGDRGVA